MLSGITTYIEESLKLKVNKGKSKVSHPVESTLLGFSFYQSKGKWEIRIAKKPIQRIKEKTREITARNNGSNTKQKLLKMKSIIQGWVNYGCIPNCRSKK